MAFYLFIENASQTSSQYLVFIKDLELIGAVFPALEYPCLTVNWGPKFSSTMLERNGQHSDHSCSFQVLGICISRKSDKELFPIDSSLSENVQFGDIETHGERADTYL